MLQTPQKKAKDPEVKVFFAQLKPLREKMNEALILEKLESLSTEIQSLKTEIQQSKSTQVNSPAAPSDTLPDQQQMAAMVQELHQNLIEMREVRDTVKAGMELTQDLEPVAKQLFPKVIAYFNELDESFNPDEFAVLVNKTLSSIGSINEALDMLRAGLELRDDMIPVAQLSYPKVVKFLNALHEGEFQAEKLGELLHTLLLNIHTFSDLMNMLSPMTELVKEFEVAMRQTDVLSNMNRWLDSLQQGNGLVKFAAMTAGVAKDIKITDEQFDQICESLSTINLAKAEPVGPIGMIKQLNDPKFQQAMGATFMLVNALGGCVQAIHAEPGHQNT